MKLFLIFLLTSFAKVLAASNHSYENYSGCGTYLIAGTVEFKTNEGYQLIINKSTRSEYRLTIPITEEPKMAPYINRPLFATVEISKPLDGTLGKIDTINSVKNRIPNGLTTVNDTGFKLIKKTDCKK